MTHEDFERLFEIKMGRILKFNVQQAEENIAAYNDRIAHLNSELSHITEYTIRWFETLKEKYGADHPRKTVIRNFENIAATTVAEANEKLYINREEGFIGTSLKKDEYLCTCSSLDDIIIIYKDGTYKVTKVQEKLSVGKNVLYVNVFKKDARTIYNVIYQDGKGGPYYMKRFNITGITRDRDYNITQGTKGSKIVWFSANPNGEAEVVKVTLKPIPRLKKLFIDVDFSELSIKGRGARGNLVTRNEVHRFSLKEKGKSTLGGRKVWFDPDILRLNYDARGNYLGEFGPDDLVLVILKNGEYYTSSFDASNHYDDNILRLEKYRPKHVWTAIVRDADQQNYPYLKRFTFEPSAKKQSFIGDNKKSELLWLSDNPGARFELNFSEPDTFRGPVEIHSHEFIAVKSFRAKGKRLTTYLLDSINELEPDEIEEPEDEIMEGPVTETDEPVIDEDDGKSEEEVRDEILGQKRIF